MDTNRFGPGTSLSDVVLAHPACVRVLREAGINPATGATLAEASSRVAVSWRALAAELACAMAAEPEVPREQQWARLSNSHLAGRLMKDHEEYLTEAARFVLELLDECRGVDEQRVAAVEAPVLALVHRLTEHLRVEQDTLLHPIRSGNATRVYREARRAVAQHSRLARQMDDLRRKTVGYDSGPHASSAYRALLDELRDIELAMFERMVVENAVLIPRLIAN